MPGVFDSLIITDKSIARHRSRICSTQQAKSINSHTVFGRLTVFHKLAVIMNVHKSVYLVDCCHPWNTRGHMARFSSH